MIAPLSMAFDVACPATRAFEVWTSKISAWWPRDHTVSGVEGADVVIEAREGGRIFEREPDGTEHDWGEVVLWRPPSRLVYLWHLGSERASATEVDVRFVEIGASSTRVEIDHRGWERLGDAGPSRRERNHLGWESLLPHYLTAVEKGA